MLLGLILLLQSYVLTLVNELSEFHGEDNKAFMLKEFSALMDQIEPKLTQKNKDLFNNNLRQFIQKVQTL